ncbi:iron-sulfur cluster co-chaperone protein HscB [Anopheles nili]|uniref:iron-sulfur cluster co-chaperone protein HscB n=1 Tax=Anopheles nili TaxID=185578 RepID=UPI00237C2010|nr:iron-sulfur cluster co-chaperone protein HscB [Anopheles nili]
MRIPMKRGSQYLTQIFKPQYKLFSAINHQKCWKCGILNGQNSFFCASCGVLRNIFENENYFKMLNLDKDFKIDSAKLTQNYRQIQTLIHPDKFSQKSEEEKVLALEWSSLINKAYTTLSKSIDRGKYLLELNGITISEDNSSIDQDFLFEMMDFNESVEDSKTANELQKLASSVSANIADLNIKLEQSFADYDMESAKETIIRLKYLVNIECTIKEKLLQLQLKT